MSTWLEEPKRDVLDEISKRRKLFLLLGMPPHN